MAKGPFFPFAGEVKCERCGETLKPATTVWLELNTVTSRYCDPERAPVPPAESQGCFAFGSACAKRVLANDGRIK